MAEVNCTPEILTQKMSYLDLPDEILYEIFREMPKTLLLRTSSLCPKFADVILNDIRLRKNISIKYPEKQAVPFEALFTGPSPIEKIDLTGCKVKPPVSPQKDGVVHVDVAKLDMTAIRTDEETIKAILVKYKSEELILDHNMFSTTVIPLVLFSMKTQLEALSLKGVRLASDCDPGISMCLAMSLVHCSSLKSLDLSGIRGWETGATDLFFGHSPKSLENLKLFYLYVNSENFELLAKNSPNLKDLALEAWCLVQLTRSTTIIFERLETLHVAFCSDNQHLFDNLFESLSSRFPKMKSIYCSLHRPYGDSCRRFTQKLTDLTIRASRTHPDVQIINGNLEANRHRH